MKNQFDTPVEWDDLRVFLASARLGSLTGAARQLGVSVATVSRRLDRLEDRLRQKLFHRHAGGLTLAPEAEHLVERAQAVMDGVLSFVRTADGDTGELAGSVTVNTIDTVMERIIAPKLASFRERYPQIRLVLRADTRVVKLSSRAADIALRVARPSEERVVCQKLATIRYGLYASRDYLERRGAPKNPKTSLHGHDLVTYDERLDHLPEALWLRQRADAEDIAFRLNSVAAMVAAVEHGAGVGVLPKVLVRGDVELLFEGDDLPERDIWLAVHEDLRNVPRVRAVMDFLREVVRNLEPAKDHVGG